MQTFVSNQTFSSAYRVGRFLWEGTLSFQRGVVIVLSMYTTLLMVTQVIFRYFLKLSIMWGEELILYLVFWFYLAGASLCTHDRSHIKGGAMQMFLGNHPRILNGINVSMALLSVGLSILFTFWGYEAFTFGLKIHRKTVQLTLPYAYTQLSLVPGFALMAVYFFAEAIDLIRAGRRLT